MKRLIYRHETRQVFRLEVSDYVEGLRLDQYLAQHVDGLSRTEARKIVDIGGVSIDGKRVRSCSRNLQKGEQIEIHTDGYALEPFRLKPDHVLYQDKDILVLNKPAGIDTQPTPARYKGTLYEALLTLLGPPARGRKKPELGMVQRLDRGTSGLMVFSTHQRAHRGLSKIFLEHRVEKRYLALVRNPPLPDSGEIRSQLARSRKHNKVISVERGGKEAITRYQTRMSNRSGALLDIELLTGRSHQIRAHLSEAGSPLFGDSLYGGDPCWNGLEFARPLLHASRLAFTHPVSGHLLEFEQPLPADMQQVCDLMFAGAAETI